MKTAINLFTILLFGAGCGKLGSQPIKKSMAGSVNVKVWGSSRIVPKPQITIEGYIKTKCELI